MGCVFSALIVALLLTGCASAATTVAPTPSGPPPNVVGKQLDQARKALTAGGWTVKAHDSVEDRAILMESNWVVTDQAVDGATVALGAKKTTDRAPGDETSGPAFARKVEKAWLNSLGVKRFGKILAVDPTSLIGWIGTIESPTDGVIEITVQTNPPLVDKDDLKRLSWLCLTAVDDPDLWRVEAVTADGSMRGVTNR